ncbi:NlpC/P60 family protein [Zobellella maritima]|uniref:NlpC/P60 family protein n=1 Tax=Zobellella maritima TaxID=2059725 RepID=UPI000E30AE5F|nr:NlpC/P60 family protein [Zobellella maritima]
MTKKPRSAVTYSISTGPSKSLFNKKLAGSGGSTPELQRVYQRWRGVPYRFGGVDANGIDCSAFTQTVYQEVYGMDLPRSTYQQVSLGRQVGKNELQPGDLVFFRTGKGMQHNGVYLGDGKFAHASSSKGVTISRLDNVYWRNRYWQARRLLDEGI